MRDLCRLFDWSSAVHFLTTSEVKVKALVLAPILALALCTLQLLLTPTLGMTDTSLSAPTAYAQTATPPAPADDLPDLFAPGRESVTNWAQKMVKDNLVLVVALASLAMFASFGLLVVSILKHVGIGTIVGIIGVVSAAGIGRLLWRLGGGT